MRRREASALPDVGLERAHTGQSGSVDPRAAVDALPRSAEWDGAVESAMANASERGLKEDSDEFWVSVLEESIAEMDAKGGSPPPLAQKLAGANPYATQPTGEILPAPVSWIVTGTNEEGDYVETRVQARTAYQAAELALQSRRVVAVDEAHIEDVTASVRTALKWTSPGAGVHRAILSDDELDRYQVDSVPGSAYGSGVEWHLTYPGSSYPDDVFDRLRDAKDAAESHFEQRETIARRQASLSIGFLD